MISISPEVTVYSSWLVLLKPHTHHRTLPGGYARSEAECSGELMWAQEISEAWKKASQSHMAVGTSLGMRRRLVFI